ncbi:MAG: hypothetical protein ACJ759_04420, partial [Thermoanaerobaculia bacterium]
PPPAPLIERLEASFPLPAALAPYEHLWASEGEPSPEGVPVRHVHGEEPVRLAFNESSIADPIQLLLDRLGTLFLNLRDNVIRRPVTGSSLGVEPDGFGDPVPPGDPIPVDGGGKPIGG